MCITISHSDRRKKRGITVAHTAGGLSRGCLRRARTQTHAHKKHTHTHTPNSAISSLCCFDDAREASQHGGAPLASGTDGQREMTHWSWLTTFLLFFLHFQQRFFSYVHKSSTIFLLERFCVHMMEDMHEHILHLVMYPHKGMCVCVRVHTRALCLSNYFLNFIKGRRLLLTICTGWGWETLRDKISDGILTQTYSMQTHTERKGLC